MIRVKMPKINDSINELDNLIIKLEDKHKQVFDCINYLKDHWYDSITTSFFNDITFEETNINKLNQDKILKIIKTIYDNYSSIAKSSVVCDEKQMSNISSDFDNINDLMSDAISIYRSVTEEDEITNASSQISSLNSSISYSNYIKNDIYAMVNKIKSYEDEIRGMIRNINYERISIFDDTKFITDFYDDNMKISLDSLLKQKTFLKVYMNDFKEIISNIEISYNDVISVYITPNTSNLSEVFENEVKNLNVIYTNFENYYKVIDRAYTFYSDAFEHTENEFSKKNNGIAEI